MKKPSKKRSWSSTLLACALGILAVVTLIIQISRCGAEASHTETTLFGILQFVFSIAFAWMLARASSKEEFADSQRQFAIAAYRRIREIERTTFRLVQRIHDKRLDCSQELEHELDVIQEVTASLLTTSRSSISDWADIIGDEIATIEKLERLRNKQLGFGQAPPEHLSGAGSRTISKVNELKDRLEEWQAKVDALMEKLPASLQVMERDEDDDDRARIEMEIAAWQELEDHGKLILNGFWEPDAELEKDIRTCSVGASCAVTRAVVGSRRGVIALRDNDGKTAGIVTNKYGYSDYATFADVLSELIQSNNLCSTLLSVDSEVHSSGRVYFKVGLAPSERRPTKDSTVPSEGAPPDDQ